MKLKPLEPGDNVKVKYTVEIHENAAVVYLDGKLIKEDGYWLVEYQLDGVKHQNYWHESDITSKHYLAMTDADLFEKVEKIAASDYTGMVFYDGRYFDSTVDFLDEWPDEYPKFVWACTSEPVELGINLEDYVSEALEEAGYEGLSERSQFQSFYEELETIQDEIVKLAAKETVCYPNYKKAVVL
jgi:hypothetical protein